MLLLVVMVFLVMLIMLFVMSIFWGICIVFGVLGIYLFFAIVCGCCDSSGVYGAYYSCCWW